MKKLFLAIVLVSSPAFGDHIKPFPDPSIIKVPPPEYDPRLLGPPPNTSVYYIAHSKMCQVCSNGGKNTNIKPGVLACAMPKKRIIYLPKGMTIPLRNAVLRHERGHIWGWRHNGNHNVQALYEDGH